MIFNFLTKLKATLEKALRDALQTEAGQKLIKNVTNASKNGLDEVFNPIVIDLNTNIGRGFESINGNVQEISQSLRKVQLQLKPNGKGGFEILTSFPVK